MQENNENKTQYSKWMTDAQNARDEIFKSLGNVDSECIAPIINTAFLNAPEWPSLSQGWCIIHKENTVVYISDGLTNPYDTGENNVGCGVECLMEISDLDSSKDIYNNLALVHLVNFSHQIAGIGDPRKILSENGGVLTMELYPSDMGLNDISEKWLNQNDRTTILIGNSAPDLQVNHKLPAGDILLLSVKLLTGDEGDFIIREGAKARKQLVDKFANEGSFHITSLKR